MSTFAALGFPVPSREDAANLARLAMRRAEGQLRLVGARSVLVHRYEVGERIELWALREAERVLASFPAYLPRDQREVSVVELTFPHTDVNPHLWVTAGGATVGLHLVNYPFIPADALTAGARVGLGLAALMPAGWRTASEHAPLLAQPPEAEGWPAGAWLLRGRVLASEAVTNPLSGIELRWCRVDAGAFGTVEAIAAEATVGSAATVSEGDWIEGPAVLRGAVLALPEAATQESENGTR